MKFLFDVLKVVVMFELAVALFGGIVNLGVFIRDNNQIYSAMVENEHARKSCQLEHSTLLKQIKREGLWDRLGLKGQPWLTY